MKGDIFPFTPIPVEDGGVSPRVLRVTDERYTCNHLYFTSRAFTPDDKKLVFESDQEGGHNLFVLDFEKNQYMQLTEGKDLDYFPYIDRNGKKVYYGYKNHLYAVDLDTCEEEILYNAEDLVGHEVFKVGGAYQSWDGKKIVTFFEANPDYGLVVTDLETGESKIILKGDQPVRHCQFCPHDNNLIVYAHEGNWDTMQARMWLINADGSDNRRVRDHDDGDEESVGHESWANTEKKLYYKIKKKSEGKIYIACFDVDAGKETVLTECPHNHGIATADDRYFVLDWSGGPMHIVDLATLEIKSLCHPNMTWRKGWSRFHPHPTSSNKGDRIVYSTDAYGEHPGVFVAEIPKD